MAYDNKSLFKYISDIGEGNARVQHDYIRILRFMFLDHTASASNAKRSLLLLEEYYKSCLNSKLPNNEQRNLFELEYSIWRALRASLEPNDIKGYSKEDNPAFNDILDNVEILIHRIKTSPGQHVFKLEAKVLSELTEQPLEEIQKQYQNLDKIKRVHGGIPKRDISDILD